MREICLKFVKNDLNNFDFENRFLEYKNKMRDKPKACPLQTKKRLNSFSVLRVDV